MLCLQEKTVLSSGMRHQHWALLSTSNNSIYVLTHVPIHKNHHRLIIPTPAAKHLYPLFLRSRDMLYRHVIAVQCQLVPQRTTIWSIKERQMIPTFPRKFLTRQNAAEWMHIWVADQQNRTVSAGSLGGGVDVLLKCPAQAVSLRARPVPGWLLSPVRAARHSARVLCIRLRLERAQTCIYFMLRTCAV